MIVTTEKEWTADELRDLRQRRNWTQAQAATAIGVTQGAWSHWERADGHTPPLSKRKLLDLIDRITPVG